MKQPALYGLHILLPDYLEESWQDWVARTPGATWPTWRGHIIVLFRFEILCALDQFEAQIKLRVQDAP